MFDKLKIYNILLTLAITIINVHCFALFFVKDFQQLSVSLMVLVLISALRIIIFVIYIIRNGFKYTGSLLQPVLLLRG